MVKSADKLSVNMTRSVDDGTIKPPTSTVFRSTGQSMLPGMVLAAAGYVFAMISLGSEHIHPKFIEEHMRYFNVTILICSIGVLGGLFYVYNHSNGYTGDHEQRYNTRLGCASLFLIYFGMAFWLVVMLTYSTSLSIMILSWVACAVAPFILEHFAKFIYHGKWKRVSENQDQQMCRVLVTNLDPDVTEVMISGYFMNIGGTIHGIQMQPEKSSALITYQNYEDADLAIRVCNSNNELLGTTKFKCSWANPESVC